MNIQKILTDIKDTGLSDYKIAPLLGTSQPQVLRWRTGATDPSSKSAEKIKKLAEQLRPDIYGN
jgi:hypothetical protein